MTQLYRLKSNPKTIVKKTGDFHQVVWSESMEKGLDSSTWMMARWNPDNVIELNQEEIKEIERNKEK